MKICYAISTVHTLSGANRSLIDLISHVKELGHECIVIAPSHGSVEYEFLNLGIEYKVIPFMNSIKAKQAIKTTIKRLYNVFGIIKILLFLRKEKVDILHNNSLPTTVGMSAARLAGIPYICHIRENVWDGLGMEFYATKSVKRLIRDSHVAIVISDYLKQTYEAFEHAGNFIIINDGVSADVYFDRKDIFKNDDVRMAMIGHINPQKNQREALDAMELLLEKGRTEIKLDIIGDDGRWKGSYQYAENLRDYIREKQIENITFLPPINNTEELKHVRKRYDINLVCSKAEGMGRVTVESMLSGSLTIGANAGATSEILEGGKCGLLYEAGNAHDLAAKIEYAIDHKKEMQALALKAQDVATHRFSPDKYTFQIIKLYNGIFSGKSK